MRAKTLQNKPNIMKSKNITKEDILILMNENRHTINFYEILWSYGMIANHLETSVYKVRQRMNELKLIKAVYFGSMPHICDYDYEYGCQCENHLPYWGWRLMPDFIDETKYKALISLNLPTDAS